MAFLQRSPGWGGLFCDMGTGKTRMALAYLRGRAQRILVVCPLIPVWREEAGALVPEYHVIDLLRGSVRERAARLLSRTWTEPVIVTVNYDAFWREPLRSAIQKFSPDAIVLDEAHRIKSRTARRTRYAHSLADNSGAVYRLALTGTPSSRGLEDLFSVYRFLDPSGQTFPRRWADFEYEYLVKGGFQNYQIVGYRNMERAREAIARTAFCITRDEALSLPERADIVVPVQLDVVTLQRYHEMRRFAVAQMDGTDEHGRPLSGIAVARIALTTLLRLQQITGGFCQTDRGIVDLGEEKLLACTSIVEDALAGGERVVVFCRFLRDLTRLQQRLSVLAPTARLAGDVPVARREAIVAEHKRGRLPVLVAQLSVGSIGIDLTAASVAVFYSLGFSLIDFLQARDRLHRIGQARRVVYYYLLASRTVDEKVYRVLAGRRDLARQIMTSRHEARAVIADD